MACRACEKEQMWYESQYDGQQVNTPNPGPGTDTGFRFRDQRTGATIPVIAKRGESREDAIARVRSHHGRK